MHIVRSRLGVALAIGMAVPLVACAFDVVTLKRSPAELTATAASSGQWRLQTTQKPYLVSGFASALAAGTIWQKIGTIGQGDVLRTRDQIVSIEASNLYQADIVVDHGQLVGFYLPVDHAFTPCSSVRAIDLLRQAG